MKTKPTLFPFSLCMGLLLIGTLQTGCWSLRFNVGASSFGPRKSIKKSPPTNQTPKSDPNGWEPSFAMDVNLGFHFPLNIERGYGPDKEFRIVWLLPEIGYSLDYPSFPGKFILSLGLAHHWTSSKQTIGLGYVPSFVVAGSELGRHVGIRNSLYLYFNAFSLQLQHEYLGKDSGNVNGFRVVVGVDVIALLYRDMLLKVLSRLKMF